MSRVMLITGASRGIGAATARLAAQQGYALCLNYHQRADAANAVLEQVRGLGVTAIAVQADVADETQVLHMFEAIDREFGRLDVLVNNAGMLEQQMRLEQMDAARWTRVLGANVIGSFLCAREAIKRMSTRHGGRGGAIVNLSSVAARLGAPGEYIDYAAAKGAIDSMTLGLAKEVASEGIRVNAVRPGVIHTDIHAAGGEPDRVERVKASVPMGRGGQAEEIAEAILWLASEQASYTSGALLDVAGGR
ncbi:MULTISPECIES: SDR family oxidoreductase [Stutzerimonas stutzeri group]|jgi:NAD(P)-dependent dehydrogenase (short-subunit alcohol dehydrogenase family)|uniref:SDR family oxidoreductase n=2 Tax=Stutzerimonas stutzeri TaxID=316 RepID=A0AA40RT61_STUST|nr:MULTISPECIES: SDR family oxidoreductase [Stutzerimonas stutzeri group]MBA4689286.1 SDR family oxidoreductase [Pseudomonas sp.]MCJ0879580.1 SDR family oxidoreductase [Pseudomonas sp. JI-2]MBA1227087.1 SDR family oxidoreductase [Stutzerimonas stutzeri]MBA1305554.1 SDR family oxidoreductase [Stutzerimonas stutzeri]MBH3352967.1 SDR family oxidoreductase [Stutzerimonas stutzeri]